MRKTLISLAFVGSLFNTPSALAELEEFEMSWFERRFYHCGRGYQIGDVATYAKTKNRLSNYKTFLSEFARHWGASEAQLEELAQLYEDGRERSRQEGFVHEFEQDDAETKIVMVLFIMMNEYCDLDKSDFADKEE